eukprot:scaffold19260_cov66-Phaeocystis_antarctica.AAC.6
MVSICYDSSPQLPKHGLVSKRPCAASLCPLIQTIARSLLGSCISDHRRNRLVTHVFHDILAQHTARHGGRRVVVAAQAP